VKESEQRSLSRHRRSSHNNTSERIFNSSGRGLKKNVQGGRSLGARQDDVNSGEMTCFKGMISCVGGRCTDNRMANCSEIEEKA